MPHLSQTSFDHTARFETLEDRVLLSATAEPFEWVEVQGDSVVIDGIEIDLSATDTVLEGDADTTDLPVPVGAQPTGALTGKIVYVHGGHGYTWDSGTYWTTQRGEGYEMVEDMGNLDQMNFLIDQLWNAGATVVPLRPAQHQLNEVVLDNDDAEVTFVGGWSNSSSPVYYGDAGDTPYRYASTASSETAYARYQPDIPEAGYYPVYTFVRAGSDRVDQLYRVHHTGGITEVTVDHTKVGNGWVYLGNFYFNEGTEGYVDISNRNNDSGVIIADAIRFGNGMGDVLRNGQPSGQSREDEAGLYWIEALVRDSQGISTSEYRSTTSSDRNSTVGATPRWAEYMNREASGDMTDRIHISYHSNAGGGRGAVGLHNTNAGGDTPNQYYYADLLGGHVNDDMQAIGTPELEHLWSNRSSNTYQASFNYGELNNGYINDEFDASILEVAFHDNQSDAELMRDPQVRQWVARSTVHALIEYFNNFNDATTDVEPPEAITGLSALTNANGEVTLNWDRPAYGGVNGDAATGYLVQTSFDGYGFDGGIYVAGGTNTSLTLTGLDASDGVHYFRVLAVNDGGVSLNSETVAANPGQIDNSSILIVNGFDRYDRTLNPQVAYSVGTIDRVRPQWMNTFDYTVQHADAIYNFEPTIGFDSVQNEDVINGLVDLSQYTTVVWILGEESTSTATFNTTEQALVESYVANGGSLFLSGSEIGWDLDAAGNGTSFYNNTLMADFVSDDANSYSATGASGSIFAGISLDIDNGDLVYDVDTPDVINVIGGSTAALTYNTGSTGGGRPGGGTGGIAAIQMEPTTNGRGGIVMLAFPFESITDQQDRYDVMAAALNFLGSDPIERPDAPEAVVAQPYSEQVVVSWQVPNDPSVVGYYVERAIDDGFERLNDTPLTDPIYLDTGLVNGVPVAYRVISVDAEGVTSLALQDVIVTPSGPSEFIADIEQAYNQLDGSWGTAASVGYNGSPAHVATQGTPATATYTLEIDQPGTYDIAAWIPGLLAELGILGTATYTISSGDQTLSGSVDQGLASSGQWLSLGSFDLAAGDVTIILDAEASIGDQAVVADAIRVSTAITDVTTDPAEITEILVGSSQWTAAFLEQVDPGRGIGYSMPTGAAQLDTLPWTNLNQISLVFSEDVFVTIDDFSFDWFGGPSAPTDFSYDPATHTATWTFASVVINPAMDVDDVFMAQTGTVLDHHGVQLDAEWTNASSETSGNGTAGGFFAYTFNVLPGEVTGDGAQDVTDIDLVLHGTLGIFSDLNGSGETNIDDNIIMIEQIIGTAFGDANLDGSVDLLDLSILASNFGQTGTGWATGDFFADGMTDLLDLSFLATNFGFVTPGPAPQPLTVVVADHEETSITTQTQQQQQTTQTQPATQQQAGAQWAQSRQHDPRPVQQRTQLVTASTADDEDETTFGLWDSGKTTV